MRDEKQLLLNEIKEKIDGSTSMIITRYEKLPPNGSWNLRERLGKAGSQFEIVRKRVFLKAAEMAGVKIDEEFLKGHIGVVFVTQPDAMPSAKVLFKFSEENSQTLEVLCGQIDGKIIPGSEVEYLSKLPSMDEMRAQFLALLVSPMSQTLAVLDAAMAGPLSVIEQKSQTE